MSDFNKLLVAIGVCSLMLLAFLTGLSARMNDRFDDLENHSTEAVNHLGEVQDRLDDMADGEVAR